MLRQLIGMVGWFHCWRSVPRWWFHLKRLLRCCQWNYQLFLLLSCHSPWLLYWLLKLRRKLVDLVLLLVVPVSSSTMQWMHTITKWSSCFSFWLFIYFLLLGNVNQSDSVSSEREMMMTVKENRSLYTLMTGQKQTKRFQMTIDFQLNLAIFICEIFLCRNHCLICIN